MSFHCLSDGTIVVVSLSHADLGAKAVFLLPIACLAMKPDDVVVQLKRNGSFDQLRKQLLTDFQNEVPTDLQVLMVKLMGFILAWRKSISCQDQQLYGVHDSQGSYATGKGPIGIPFVGNEWTGKVRSCQYFIVQCNELVFNREGMYQSVKEQVLENMLQKKDYQDQIDEQMEQVLASRQESSSSWCDAVMCWIQQVTGPSARLLFHYATNTECLFRNVKLMATFIMWCKQRLRMA